MSFQTQENYSSSSESQSIPCSHSLARPFGTKELKTKAWTLSPPERQAQESGRCVFIPRFHLALRILARYFLSRGLSLLICIMGGLKEIKNKKACKAFCSEPDTQEAAIIVTAQSLPRAKIGSSVLRSPNQPSPYLSLALLPLPASFASLQLHPPPTSFLSRSHCLE